MGKIILTERAAQRIVERGSVKGFTETESIRRPQHTPPSPAQCRCWLTNDGAEVIRPGDMAAIHAMTDSDLETEEAVERWVNEGIRGKAKLIGNIDDANSGRLVRAIALDEIAYGETGRGEALGGFMARVWRDPEEYNELERFTARADWRTITLDGVKIRRLACVRYPGDYALIDATRPDSENNLFGLLTPSLPGHITTSISSVDIPGKRVTLSCGVTAAYPIGDITEKLIGKNVILSRGVINRRWEVIVLIE